MPKFIKNKFESKGVIVNSYNRNKISECINGKRKHAGKHPITGEKLSWVKLENKNC